MSSKPVDYSVIIPTFRRPKELTEALSSALSQEGVTVEAFVIDDSAEGSAQGAVEGLRDSRVTYVRNPCPTGGVPSVVRNLGWPLASGDSIHFLDDDDIVPEGHYLRVKEIFSRQPDVGLIFGRVEPFGDVQIEQLQKERSYFARAARRSHVCQRFGSKWGFVASMLFGDALLVCSASILRRQCVEQLAGFDPEIRLMEDADFHVRAMREFGAYFMDRISIHYRIGANSLMHSPTPSASQLQYERAGHRKMQGKYQKRRGALEFYALALFERSVLG